MAGQYRFKDQNGNIVAQISASVGGAIAFSGSVVDFSQANNVILGNVQLAGTASNALLLDGFDSQAFAFTSSIHPFTASIAGTNTFTSSAKARLDSIETISASNVSRLDSLEIKTGSLATTGSNTFIGTQTITGSLFISSNLIVQGTSSLQNITASAVSIGTNIVNLNTANPAIRYAGLVIGDSGSIGSSGSFLYDSVQDEMIFVHRGASTIVTSSVTLMGPETYDNVGSETYPTLNIIQKGTGNEHLANSCIFEAGGCVGINTTSISSTYGTLTIAGTGASIVDDGNAKLQIGRYSSTACNAYIKMGANACSLRFSNNTDLADLMVIEKAGNVGIAHTSPVDRMDIMGSLRIRCNTPNFTAVCNSLVIDFVPTAVFGSNPMARYYAIGCTGISAGHTFTIGPPTAPVSNAFTIFGDGKVAVNTDNSVTNTVGNPLVLRSSSSNAGQTALVIQDYRKCNRWAVNGQSFPNDATLTIYSTPNNTNDYTPVFSITQNGQVQTPSNAAFHAAINDSTNIGIGGVMVKYNCVIYNAGGGYNGTTSTFTAPVSGMYQFNFTFLSQNTQNTTGGHAYLSTNFGGGTYYFTRYGCNSGTDRTGYGSYVPMHGAIALYLPAGCKACVGSFWDADGAFTHNSTSWSNFTGYLVG